MNLILIDSDAVDAEGRVSLVGHHAEHIRKILRAEPGDRLRVGLLNGPRGIGTVRSVSERAVELECVFELEPPPRPCVDLLLALPRPKVMKRLWAQIAALGVDRILLTHAARVERCYFDTHVLDPTVYTPLLIEGLQQAQDTRLPHVSVHRRLKPLVERLAVASGASFDSGVSDLSDAPYRIVLHPGSPHELIETAPADPAARVLLAIGPEGGWVPYELELFERHGFRVASLGSRTLRSDTACIAALAILHARKRSQKFFHSMEPRNKIFT
jgi:RsmE family RNA methyltransferase